MFYSKFNKFLQIAPLAGKPADKITENRLFAQLESSNLGGGLHLLVFVQQTYLPIDPAPRLKRVRNECEAAAGHRLPFDLLVIQKLERDSGNSDLKKWIFTIDSPTQFNLIFKRNFAVDRRGSDLDYPGRGDKIFDDGNFIVEQRLSRYE